MTVEPSLMRILACPVDKGRLWLAEDGSFLYNPRLRLAYEVREAIPVMLADEARRVDDAEHAHLEASIAAGRMTSSL
ncbi:MAG: Trm112 family protein [Actinobacteria bacterium]|nr:Trm112 family protein [Actinomycetota bacterium]